MNLSKMLTSAVQDFSWLENPENLDVSGHDNPNSLPELELQWGMGPTIHGETGEVVYTPEDAARDGEIDNVEVIAKTARLLIAAGQSGQNVVAVLRAKFGDEAVQGAKKELREAFKWDGIAGTIAVDCRDFEDPHDAYAHARKSPHRQHLAYVINYDSAKTSERVDRQEFGVGGGSIDGLFASEGHKVVAKAPVCKELGMPVLAYDELPDEFMDSTLVDVMTLSDELSEEEIESIRAKKMSAFSTVREVFREIERKRHNPTAGKYSGKVDASDHKIEKSEVSFEISSGVEALDVNPERPSSVEAGLDGLWDKKAEVEERNEDSLHLLIDPR